MRHSLRGSMVILGSTISATRCLPCCKPSLFHFSPRNLHFRLSSSPVRSNYSFLHSLPNQHQTDLSFVTKASTEEGHVSVLDNKASDFSASVSCSTIPLKNGETIDVNPPRGTRDFLPEDMQFRNWLFQKFREVSRLFAFEEVDFPLLEAEALYVRKGGEEITKQLYNFEDKGGRRVALRPELTPSLARVIMQKGNTLLPIKWFAIGQCWRYERTTRGRRREHYQWNMDIMGISGMEAEAELISAIVTFFVKVGITSSDVVIKVSSRKVLQEVLDRYLISRDVFTAVCIIVDKIEKMPAEDIIKELTAIGITADTAVLILQNLSLKSLDDLEELLGSDSEAVMELKDLFSYAAHYGYSDWLCFDASVVRGLAYYTGIVFEGFDRSRKLRAICGGGRYDQLLSTFGGDDVPACGFGFGDAVIVELLKEKNLMPNLSREIDDIVWPLSRELRQAAAMVTSTLRKRGYNVDLILEDKKSKWVFKYAEKINAKRLIIVGDEEWKRGAIRVKNLCTREQSDILLTDLS